MAVAAINVAEGSTGSLQILTATASDARGAESLKNAARSPSHVQQMCYLVGRPSIAPAPMKQLQNSSTESSKLHWLFLSDASRPTEPYNTVLCETRNFAVLPTKGSIVPGWVLVIPKFPITRLADVPKELRGELDDIVCSTIEGLQSRFGNVYSFEHGGFARSKVSCGVDQAHLHIACLDFDLLDAVQLKGDKQWVECVHSRVPSDMPIGDEYWFVSSNEKSIFAPVVLPESQFFRKVIARHAGRPNRWDYRIDGFEENVKITIKALAGNE